MHFYANIFVRTVLTDLLHTSCQSLYPIDNIVTTNNFEHCHVYTTRFFSVVKSNLFIRALLLDHILVTAKTTRTPRVHLVFHKIVYLQLSCQLVFHVGLVIHKNGDQT